MSKLFTYVSLFSGAGVGCYGFKQENFKCIATNEILSKRLKIQLHNNKCKYDTGYLNGDITNLEIKQKLFNEIKFWKKNHNIKNVDIIIATPPCQGMSVANHKKKNEIVRNSLIVESIKIVKNIQPKFFIFENVRSFLTTICTDVDNIDKSIEETINNNLAGHYNILAKIINFKEYGSHSSRTRTLVIGVRKDIHNITPYDIFPKKVQAKTLRELIGHLPTLKEMGEISNDIFHSFRKFNLRMLPWIENLKEGESAFDNKDPLRIPHRIINGNIVYNQSKNGDKYARWYWDRVAPCIHTRNDILSSQNTIHPQDNRVFSIREIMKMLSIPDSFEWSNIETKQLNKLSLEDKRKFLKKEELNIRHCLGEAVPTAVFANIALNIKNALEQKSLTLPKINRIILKYKLFEINNLITFIKKNIAVLSLSNLYSIAELANSKRQDTAAYFTRKDIAYSVVKSLPSLKKKKTIKILEPAVGIGVFIPLLIKKYENTKNVIIDICDIDNNSLKILNIIINNIGVPSNFTINLVNKDFLLWNIQNRYDIVLGNPPYKKVIKQKQLLAQYKSSLYNTNTNNLFAFFIEKAIKISRFVSFIVPKSLINSPEFNKTRDLVLQHNLKKICDYGEKAFRGVKIETISFLLDTAKSFDNKIIVESYINNYYLQQQKKYIFSKDFPYWLIYRNKIFDKTVSKMRLGIFSSFRDRQITKANLKKEGLIRVLKARNIGNNEINNLDNYDCYIDDYDKYSVAKFLNKTDIVLVPNLTYYPRAAFLPKNTIVDGSVALLILKDGEQKLTKEDLDFYSSKEFEMYYRVARNYGTRSLNIDNNSVYFFGILK
ncbi:MAG: DNA (cytosine-5-)-methyltransferase [Chitinophagales bacterium]